ncbi:NrsF family protein [Magnetovibrio sp. PR-2]|uniref:NrsF family protein n=1 Tax=Magnetovibrio sp. PR-2 TaxID=3120356 RepID=UPI002FCE14A3
MNMSTHDLISNLSDDLAPVKRLAHPAKRLLMWMGIAFPVSLIMGALVEQQSFALAFVDGESFSLAKQRLTDWRSLLELTAIFATALTAGYAALCGTQPGRAPHAWVLPIVPFAAWLALITESCFELYQQIGPDQFSFAPHWTCYPSVVATGAAPALVMVILLKRGMLATPSVTVGMAVLAASALGAVGLRLFHPPDATAMLLMWQLIATLTLYGVASLISVIRAR